MDAKQRGKPESQLTQVNGLVAGGMGWQPEIASVKPTLHQRAKLPAERLFEERDGQLALRL